MASYRASVETSLPIQEAFAYLSDFANAAEWDPGVVQAQRLDQGQIGEGSRFRLVARFMGRDNELIYTITEFSAPDVVRFRGESPTVISDDRLSFETIAGGTRLTYDAQLTLKGALRLADPLLALAFKPVGDRALAGLRGRLPAVSGQA